MKWATLFFLQYVEMKEPDSNTEYDLEDDYLQCFTDTLAKNMEKTMTMWREPGKQEGK